jgi:alpha-glucosidase
MSQISTYFAHLVDEVDKWAVFARDVIDQTSLRTLAGVAGILSSLSTSATSTTIATCPGYSLKDVVQTTASLTATLQLAGKGCNVYGPDIEDLSLLVEYQTGK